MNSFNLNYLFIIVGFVAILGFFIKLEIFKFDINGERIGFLKYLPLIKEKFVDAPLGIKIYLLVSYIAVIFSLSFFFLP